MDMKEYEKNVSKTESGVEHIKLDNKRLRLLHACLGITSEAGEISDNIKRNIYYGTDLDVNNLVEEAGDVLYYLSVLLNSVGATLDKAMDANIKKLKIRYPGGFSKDKAVNRDQNLDFANVLS